MKSRHALIGFLISFTVSIALMYMTFTRFEFLEAQEKQAYDLKMTLIRGEKPTTGNVVIAAIDERSLDVFGRWPWARSVQGDLIRKLSSSGARVIGLDVNYSEEDKNASLVQLGGLVRSYRQLGLLSTSRRVDSFEQSVSSLNLSESTNSELRRHVTAMRNITQANVNFFRRLQEEEEKARTDIYLARKISESDNTILGYFFYMYSAQIKDLDPADYMGGEDRIHSSAVKMIQEMPNARRTFSKALGLQPNIEVVANASKDSGYYNMAVDSDGTVRFAPLFIEFQDNIYPSLALKSVMEYFDMEVKIVLEEWGVSEVQLFDPAGERAPIMLPASESGELMINYRGGQESFPTFSVAEIMSDDFDENKVKDKVVLIGPTAIGIYDMRVTPFSEIFPGVEIHANIIDNIIAEDFIVSPGDLTQFIDIVTLLLIGIMLGLIIPRVRALTGLLIVTAFLVSLFSFNVYLFIEHGYWLHIVYPTFGMLGIYLAITIYRYFAEERERKKLKGAFQTYVSADVVDFMMKNPDSLKLGGERKELSVLFSDIRGFTTISEKLPPDELSHVLNTYLTPMTDLVFQSGGTLDKYMGDAIMAFWGAPVDEPDHAIRACDTALDMMKELYIMQKQFAEKGLPYIDIGIGVNTGDMSVGNMGSEIRFDYTVMGDAVNLGSRLEGINKDYGTNIVVSQYTLDKLPDEFFARHLDRVSVKGKKEPVDIYELMGKGTPTDIEKKIREFYVDGLHLHHDREFDKAIAAFEEVLKVKPDDKASVYLIERCRMYKESPPTDDWDGAFIKTSK
jgi:adenylate cyclase